VLALTDDFLYATSCVNPLFYHTFPFGTDFLYRDVSIWSTVEAGLGIIAASAYTLRPLFRQLLGISSQATAVYAYSTGAGTNHTGYIKNGTGLEVENRRGFPNSQLRILNSVELVSKTERTHDPFENSNKNLSSLSTNGEQGGIQIHTTFGTQTVVAEEAHETPFWPTRQPMSSVSVV
jgi:hypothetical protein